LIVPENIYMQIENFEKLNIETFSLMVLLFGAIALLIKKLLYIIKLKYNLGKKKIIIFGSGSNADDVLELYSRNKKLNIDIKNYSEINDKKTESSEILKWKWTGLVDNIEQYHCLIAMDGEEIKHRENLISELMCRNVKEITVIPSMRGVPLFTHVSKSFIANDVLMIKINNRLKNNSHIILKRIFDIVSSIFIMLGMVPLAIILIYAIWRDDGFPVIYIQKRVGKNGEKFNILKFRTMKKNAEEILRKWKETNSREWIDYVENNFKLKEDPRMLKVGKIIRKWSLDELPQVINVIKGEMSLVGPRPLLIRELNEYGEDYELYKIMKPGITGLWQINGRSKTTFKERVKFDRWYVTNWSILLDIYIIIKTVGVVLMRKGAH
jgi:undecaprenyl-phosphate galactose phosphotransferase